MIRSAVEQEPRTEENHVQRLKKARLVERSSPARPKSVTHCIFRSISSCGSYQVKASMFDIT